MHSIIQNLEVKIYVYLV